jgi:hypothetical protein
MALRMAGAGTALAVAVSMAVAGVTTSPANAAASVSIDDPGAPTAGTVTVTGKVGAGAGGATSVVYVIDASGSTQKSPVPGYDCSGNGALGTEDDVNNDRLQPNDVGGDVLDCEISGVLALNRSLPSAGVQVGLVGLAGSAAAADVDPDPARSAALVPPHFTGGSTSPLIEEVATSVVRHRIGKFETRELVQDGTDFGAAINVALSTLAGAPAGPKWIMFLSDGAARVDDPLLAQLQQSGVRLRSFGIGASASCDRFGSLSKLATATGETCQLVPNPASLAAALTSQPDSVNGVTVTINGVSLAADLDALGGWSANFKLGAGTYTATARALLASGGTATTQRTFTVAPSADGPPPGTVTSGKGSLKATAIKVNKPRPTRKTLPASVTGRVGRFTSRFETTKKLEGSRVVLEARRAAGAPWEVMGSDKVSRSGDFQLKWRVKKSMTKLRVVLRPHRGYAASIATVPAAAISGCTVTKRGSGWTLKCSTTAKKGSRVRLLRNGKATSFARVKNGGFSLRGTGPIGRFSVDVTAGKRHIRLPL